MSFDDALRLAQEKGYAEKDPTADIEGHDACRKICILASLGFGRHVYPEQVKTEGITGITATDVEYADSLGYVIKLIGRAQKLESGKICASVRPTLVSRENILSDVSGVFNAIMVNGDETGDVMFYGRGAGKAPTASAVVADVIDCAKHLTARKYLFWEDGSPDYVTEADLKVRLYVYAKSSDYDSLIESSAVAFPDLDGIIKNSRSGEIAFITDEGLESQLRERISSIKADSIKVMHTLS